MAQFYSEVDEIAAVFANNKGVDTTGTQTVLEDIPCMGVRNLAVTIVCNSGSISAVGLLGSPDGINYMAISGFSSFAVSAGNMGHAEVSAVYQYLRVTVTGTANIDVYLYAVQ